MDGKTTSTRNQISELPDVVIHHILSFLSSKEAARTSVLSKSWLSAWRTNPILVFMQNHYNNNNNLRGFFNFVDQTMSRYQDDCLAIETFRLHAALQKNLTTSDVDRWIQISLQHGVKILSLILSPKLSYSLPHSVFATRTLIELDLCQCKLEFSESLDIYFDSLLRLHLKRVRVDEYMIHKLLFSAPLLQLFTINLCIGFKNISLGNLDYLRYLEIGVTDQMEAVEIDVPSLETFSYSVNEWNTAFDVLEIYSTQNLKRLCINGDSKLTDEWLHDLIAECPLLEDLELQNCTWSRNIDISSNLLRRLKIHSCEWLREIRLDTPNLVSFDYCPSHLGSDSLSFTQPPSELLKTLVSSTIGQGSVSSYFFKGLHSLLTNVIYGSNVSISVHSSLKSVAIDWRALKELQPLEHQLEVLLLDVPNHVSPSIYYPLVEGLLCTSHPSYIYTCTYNIELVKFLCQILIIYRENPDCSINCSVNTHRLYICRGKSKPIYTFCGHKKNWAYYLKHVEIEINVAQAHYTEYLKDELWEPVECTSLEDEPHYFEENRGLRFKLNWF